MEITDKTKVVLKGEIWERISSPAGWRNATTGVTAGDPWMEAKLEEEKNSAR